MNKKIFLIIIEFAWIVMALFCLGMAIYYHVEEGIVKAWLMYGLSAISLGMFGVRRIQRKNNSKRRTRNL